MQRATDKLNKHVLQHSSELNEFYNLNGVEKLKVSVEIVAKSALLSEDQVKDFII